MVKDRWLAMSSEPDLRAMKISVLAEHCKIEINDYHHSRPSGDRHCVEMLRRATVECDQLAWQWFQQSFSELVCSWVRRDPRRDLACRFDSEENYVTQAFARFWLAAVCHQRREFSTLAAALKYLHACVNGAILDTLRAYTRLREEPLPEPDEPGEPFVEDEVDDTHLWEFLRNMFPLPREQRLAYLLFYCGLKPRQIVRYCPQEFSDVREIYSRRRSLLERVLRNADQLRQHLGLA
jgi:DNA-directed RNA polymerase specialized sigma24 family protein